MKVHCPKCNSVNFLPSTLPSSIISNISCAVCKEMIDVPVAPEYDLPDEELMDVSSLRDKLDDKGRLLNSNAFDSDETADTGSLDSHQLPPLEMDDTILPVYDDMPAPPSNETFAMVDDETTPLSLPSFDETVGLRQNDFQFHIPEQTEPEQSGQTSIFPQPGEFQQPYDFGQPQNYPQTYSFPQNQAYEGTQDFPETDYSQQAQDFSEVEYSQETQALNQTQDFTQSQQTNNDDIWAHLRKETEQMQLSNAPTNTTPQEFAPVLLEADEPRRKSGGLKFLVFGFLFLLMLGVGAGALWLYLNSGSDETTARREQPNLQTTSNPAAKTSNSNVTPVGSANTSNANTKPSSNTNTSTKNSNTTNTNAASPQNSNTEQTNSTNTQGTTTGTRERVVKNTNSGTQNSAGSGAGDGKFTIQVGSYPNAEGANSRVSQLQSSGFPARVVVANIPRKGTWYRVQVGRYATREEADRVVRDMKSKGASKEFFVTEVQ